MEDLTIVWNLDPWEWQGIDEHELEINPEDFYGMNDAKMKSYLHTLIRKEAESKMHLVYGENDILRDIKDALAEEDSQEEGENEKL